MEKKHGNVEENLSKALMRGICALNMEAMSVLQKPHVDGHPSIENLEFGSSNQRTAGGYPLSNSSGSRQNSIVNSIAPQPRAAAVASNVYLDTVSSLDDFASGSTRLKVRNSSEFTGSMASTRGRVAPKPSKGPVTYKHDPRDGAPRRVREPRKPNEPWKPVGSKTKREPEQQRPSTAPRHGFTAVKHY